MITGWSELLGILVLLVGFRFAIDVIKRIIRI